MAWLEKPCADLNVRLEKDLWAICPKCKAHVGKDEWKRTYPLCPRCGAPRRIGCRDRIAEITDKGSFAEIAADVSTSDPLSFVSAGVRYADKAAETKAKTGLEESIIVGTAAISGVPVVLGVMDFAFFGGSLGSGTGERIVCAADEAIRLRRPLVLFCASGGARMHEGIVSLMQMSRTTAAIARLHEEGLPYIAVLTDPTTGGVSASYAFVGDLVISEPQALIGFAGRRVIENTIKQKLPDDFQTAEYLKAHGFLDAIVERKDLTDWLAKTLSYFRPSQSPAKVKAPSAKASKAKARSAWETVQLARDKDRPTIRDYIELACDDFIELHGDRLVADDPALVGGFATIAGIKVMLLGHLKGRTMEENLKSNFGMANPDGYRKALRLMRLAEFFHLPVVTLVDTPGAYPGLEAEARGQAEAIARNLYEMARLKTPIVSVITGEGGSGGAIGLAVGDRVMMLQNAVYSVISPEGCASILWRDGHKAAEAAEALKITSGSLLGLGIIDAVIPEGGTSKPDKAKIAANVKAAVAAALSELIALPVDELVDKRYAKIMALGGTRGKA
ncbi:MAG: acetyl-CoA carboxylase carboxyltransferase subunit alpha [Kiritimatiellae bacterium]|nr:acetyl-CoA carboxylase carboxyltransferase subunit alpha [Kiritimatiellia bacterium]